MAIKIQDWKNCFHSSQLEQTAMSILQKELKQIEGARR
jgi:hypothetical protein